MNLKLVKIGDLLLEVCEEFASSLYAKKLAFGGTGGSTVTLIQGEKNVLVDTGFERSLHEESINEKRNHEILTYLLQRHNVSPKDIDTVIFTHLHQDHTGNYALFPRATLGMSAYCCEKCLLPHSEPLQNGEEIMDKVSVFYTPGHTKGHLSVKIDLEDTIVIAGDAIVSLPYLLQKKHWCYNPDYYSDQKSSESVQKILEIADFIIPGHGSIFKNKGI
ncbi:MAG: MBL fold metallo-hydrolase [Candidatus Methanofastidiosia archaeon]|jgi:glyoxylase-like metal-dependent hydrolase (beta-lactamase superfamily II)